MEAAVTAYLRRATDTFDLSKNVEVRKGFHDVFYTLWACRLRKFSDLVKVRINHAARGLAWLIQHSATYGRKVEDIYEYSIPNNGCLPWFSTCDIQGWLICSFLAASQQPTFQFQLWFVFSKRLSMLPRYRGMMIQTPVCLWLWWSMWPLCFVSRSFSEDIPSVCDPHHVMNGYQISGHCFLFSRSWELAISAVCNV